ncbi:hypothetical protein HZB03_01305 [Candidatus Woesearchaeota archaeon]|nr:hypothetical protein [Candidatus Woesearchaeota archaeon]
MWTKNKVFRRRWFRTIVGYTLVFVGVVGLFLPILQGTLLIMAGLLILKPRFLRKHLQKFKVQFKKSEIKTGK